MRYSKWVLSLGFVQTFFAWSAGAQASSQSLDVLTGSSGDMNGVVLDNSPPAARPIAGALEIRVQGNCYPVNLRGGYPATNGSFSLQVKKKDGSFQSFSVPFYAGGGFATTQRFKDVLIATGQLKPDGSIDVVKASDTIKNAKVVTGNVVAHSVSPDGGVHSFVINYPGPAGTCGTFISPLMLFFGTERPTFTGQSQFPIDPTGKTIHWPEAGHVGHFLAMDRDGDGAITNGGELFGSVKEINGFEVLKALDSNGDKQIDAKDAEFKKLVLWNDANGDGVSQKGEIFPVSKKGLVSIDLNYKGGRALTFGGRAEGREYSTFKYRSPASKKIETAEVLDVWFNGVQ